MSITTSALCDLHRIHQQLSDLSQRLAQGPRQVRTGQSTVQRLEQQLATTKETLIKARVAAADRQLQLKHRENRIADLQIKLNACSSNREYQALREQIAADRQANNVLEDEILESLERIDELQASMASAEASLAKAKVELQKSRERVEQDQHRLETDLARVKAELRLAEASLPPDFKDSYDRIVRARGEEALAQVERDCCGSCFQVLSPQTLNELRMGKPVFCKHCGCLLYLPDSGSPPEK